MISNKISGSIQKNNPPTIAVMPFKNMSNDAEQEYFAYGVTEDIISNLYSWKSFPIYLETLVLVSKIRTQRYEKLLMNLMRNISLKE